MTRAEHLTPAEHRTLKFIRSYRGIPVSAADVMFAFGLKDRQSAHQRLWPLLRQGLVERQKGVKGPGCGRREFVYKVKGTGA